MGGKVCPRFRLANLQAFTRSLPRASQLPRTQSTSKRTSLALTAESKDTTTWSSLGLHPDLVKAVGAAGLKLSDPTETQSLLIPHLLLPASNSTGKRDSPLRLLFAAETGTVSALPSNSKFPNFTAKDPVKPWPTCCP